MSGKPFPHATEPAPRRRLFTRSGPFTSALALVALVTLAAGCGGGSARPDRGDGGAEDRLPDDATGDLAGDAAGDAGSDTAADFGPDGPITLGRPEACHPLGVAQSCLVPFPSSVYLAVDATSTTGFRVALPAEAMPSRSSGPIDPAPFNRRDGFSPATPILVHLEGPDGEPPGSAGLPPVNDPALSLRRESATVIVDMATGERVAHFAEIDATATGDEPRLVHLRPLARLAPGSRYAVGVTRALRTASGGELQRPPGFQALLDGREVTDAPRLDQNREALLEAVASLEKAGVPRSELLVAWDFWTSSEDQLSMQLLDMRDRGLALLEPDAGNAPLLTITDVQENPRPDSLRVIHGTFKAPLYLTNNGLPGGTLSYGKDGRPELLGVYDVPFVLLLPAVAADRPVPLYLIGHGIFGSAEQINDATIGSFANMFGFALLATDLIGFAENDAGLLVQGLQNIDNLRQTTDRLQQGLINLLALSRLASRDLPALPELQVGDRSAVDGTLNYIGVSFGGIMGGAYLGLSQDVEKGALGVPGGNWSLMIPRSIVYATFEPLLSGAYRDHVEQQVILGLVQMLFDPADPISYAPYVTRNPLPNTPAKQVLIAMSVGDALVSNLATAMLGRTLGIPYLVPSALDIPLMEGAPGPLDSAVGIWDSGAMPLPPETNTYLPEDNNAHVAIFVVPELWEQITTFLAPGGQVVHTCDGPCDPR